MLYELIAVGKAGNRQAVKDVARSVGNIIVSRQGVIRDIKNWGTYLLPKPLRQGSQIHGEGHHFVMRFDSSPQVQEAVRKMLGLDPRILRYGVVKMSDQTVPGFANQGTIHWTRKATSKSTSPITGN